MSGIRPSSPLRVTRIIGVAVVVIVAWVHVIMPGIVAMLKSWGH